MTVGLAGRRILPFFDGVAVLCMVLDDDGAKGAAPAAIAAAAACADKDVDEDVKRLYERDIADGLALAFSFSRLLSTAAGLC